STSHRSIVPTRKWRRITALPSSRRGLSGPRQSEGGGGGSNCDPIHYRQAPQPTVLRALSLEWRRRRAVGADQQSRIAPSRRRSSRAVRGAGVRAPPSSRGAPRGCLTAKPRSRTSTTARRVGSTKCYSSSWRPLAGAAEHRNLLVTGLCGVGKSWLSCALAQKACRDGYTVLYTRVPPLFADLELAHGDGRFTPL